MIIKRKQIEKQTAEVKKRGGGRGEEKKGQNPSSLFWVGPKLWVFFCPTLMSSETSCDDVTVVDASFPAAGGVGELWEVRSSLVVQTVHPVLVD